jgi:hypothetical protein
MLGSDWESLPHANLVRAFDASLSPKRAGESTPAGGRSFRIWYKLPMHFDAAHPLVPIASLAAGVFLLIAPRIVSVAVAVYLIIVGILGLNGIYHFFK